VLAAITRAIVRGIAPERILLFGSFARGDRSRTSDLDLAVIAATAQPFCDRIGEVLVACEDSASPAPVEPRVHTPDEWARMLAEGRAFAHHVEREARLRHDRSPRGRGAQLAPPGPA
jgi:predicted nucleotidyltransferase